MTDILDRWNTHYARCHTITDREALGQELAQEVERLRAALKPFSEEAGWWFSKNYNASESLVEGFSDYPGRITCGDLFNARAALHHDKGEE